MDDLVLPFRFVPYGAPDPADWKERHPDWFSVPATLMLRAQAPSIFGLPTSPGTPLRVDEYDPSTGGSDTLHSHAANHAAWHPSQSPIFRSVFPDRRAPGQRPNIVEAGYSTMDERHAARGLGMSYNAIGRAIHRLKEALGLRGDENLLIEVPSGNVYFNGEIVGNLRDE